MDISEDELVTAIGRVLSGSGPDVLVPVGDDAAVVRGGTGDLVLTTDALVEGTHFDRALSTPRESAGSSGRLTSWRSRPLSDTATRVPRLRSSVCG